MLQRLRQRRSRRLKHLNGSRGARLRLRRNTRVQQESARRVPGDQELPGQSGIVEIVREFDAGEVEVADEEQGEPVGLQSGVDDGGVDTDGEGVVGGPDLEAVEEVAVADVDGWVVDVGDGAEEVGGEGDGDDFDGDVGEGGEVGDVEVGG